MRRATLTLAAGSVVFSGAVTLVSARQQTAARVAIDADDIGGIVSGPRGPEAGVWVIAETGDLPTKFRKIVVTDDRGRFVLPDLPEAKYEVWVRGYGLIDSPHVLAAAGERVALTAVAAPSPKAAAQYYPASYWYSLMQMPPKRAFPLTIPGAGRGGDREGALSGEGEPRAIQNQVELAGLLKCNFCHQLGNLATRELSRNPGAFDSSATARAGAWDRALRSGQNGLEMLGRLDRLGHERGLAMFADWSGRIAAGEVPEAPPRPSGLERSVVITLWDVSGPTAFVHDVVATDRRHPTVNAHGPVYGTEWSQDAIVSVDPIRHARGLIRIPLKDESDRKSMPVWSPQSMPAPSPIWGEELIWKDDTVNPHTPAMDAQGRVWFNANTQRADRQAPYCKAGSSNPFAKNFPIPRNARGIDVYDPATGRISVFNLCFTHSHLTMGEDRDDTIFFSTRGVLGGIGWVKARVLLETGDEEKAQGWCPSVLDYNGDGIAGAYTRAPAPPDRALDRLVPSGGYGIATSPVDGSVWFASPISQSGPPGRIFRMHPGSNPPATCITEAYEPPYDNPARPVGSPGTELEFAL